MKIDFSCRIKRGANDEDMREAEEISTIYCKWETRLVLAIVLLGELQDAIAEAEDEPQPGEARVVQVLHADRLRRPRAAGPRAFAAGRSALTRLLLLRERRLQNLENLKLQYETVQL